MYKTHFRKRLTISNHAEVARIFSFVANHAHDYTDIHPALWLDENVYEKIRALIVLLGPPAAAELDQKSADIDF